MKTNDHNSIRLKDCTSNLTKVIFAFTKIDGGMQRRLKAGDIREFLIESGRVNISQQAINSILGKNKKYFNKGKEGYLLMDSGLELLNALVTDKTIYYLESGKPYSVRNIQMESFFLGLQNYALITDPYFDLKTIDLLYKNIDKNLHVKFITVNIKESSLSTIRSALNDIEVEGYKVDVRLYNMSPLHDRLIIDENSLWISGNSLNGLGSKESFIINAGSDIKEAMEAVFNRRWKVSQNL